MSNYAKIGSSLEMNNNIKTINIYQSRVSNDLIRFYSPAIYSLPETCDENLAHKYHPQIINVFQKYKASTVKVLDLLLSNIIFTNAKAYFKDRKVKREVKEHCNVNVTTKFTLNTVNIIFNLTEYSKIIYPDDDTSISDIKDRRRKWIKQFTTIASDILSVPIDICTQIASRDVCMQYSMYKLNNSDGLQLVDVSQHEFVSPLKLPIELYRFHKRSQGISSMAFSANRLLTVDFKMNHTSDDWKANRRLMSLKMFSYITSLYPYLTWKLGQKPSKQRPSHWYDTYIEPAVTGYGMYELSKLNDNELIVSKTNRLNQIYRNWAPDTEQEQVTIC